MTIFLKAGRWAGAVLLVAAGLAATGSTASAAAADTAVQATWSASMRTATTVAKSDFTCRFTARTSVGGSAVRIKLSNVFGTAAITLGPVRVGITGTGGAVSSNTAVTFSGNSTVTIPAGNEVYSDRIELAVADQQDLAVSIHTSASSPSVTYTPTSRRTHGCTASEAGDHSDDTAATAFTTSTSSIYWLTGLDVYRSASTGTVVALGDSITEGYTSGFDDNKEWVRQLAGRLTTASSTTAPSVVNAGISGNMACTNSASWGPGGVSRFTRDVLGQTGVKTVIIFLGTNDLDFGGATGSDVIACLKSMADTAHSNGLRVIGATIIPRRFSGTKETYRTTVNTWVRTTNSFDGYLDFDAVVRSTSDSTYMNSAYDADAIHPNNAGHTAMANAVDLALFGPQVLSDDFEDGNADGWTTTGGTWSVVQPSGHSKEYHRTSSGETISSRGSSSWTNYTVQSYVKVGSTDSAAGLMARMQADNKFYLLELGRDVTGSGAQIWGLWKNNGGAWTKLASGSYAFDTNTYYLLRLTVNGNTLSAAVSTTWGSSFNELGSATDSTFSSGYIGLRPRGAGAAFDAVKVTLAS